MQLAYVVPGPMSSGVLGSGELERRRDVLQRIAFPGTEVVITEVEDGPSSVESAYEEYLAVPGTVEACRSLEEQGLDGCIVGCFGDPGVDAVREVIEIPVVGPGEAAMLTAASLGHRFSIVTILDSIIPPLRKLAWSVGVLDKVASIRSVGIPVLELYEDSERTFARMVEVGRRCLEEDGADTLILGCMTMAFAERHLELQDKLGVPVVSPAHAALKYLEGLVSCGLRHSKLAYPVPPKLAPEVRR